MRRRRSLAFVLTVFAGGVLVGMTGSTFSAFSSSTSNSDSFSSAPDWTAPVVTASVVGKTTGGTPAGGRPGAVKTNATYRAYANVSDSGNPASGVNTVTANLSSVTSGQTAVALTSTGGPWTIDGTSYNYRSAQLTATATGNSTFTYPVAAVDLASNGASYLYPVTIDNTAPSASDVQITNGTGTFAHPDAGDKITLTFSEPIDPYSIIPLTSWNGTTATNVVVRLLDGGGQNDSVQIWNSSNFFQVNLGSIGLGSKSYNTTGSTITFGASGTASTMVESGSAITITLGTQSATAGTLATTTTLSWAPSASAFDIAGNAMSTTSKSESGAADADF